MWTNIDTVTFISLSVFTMNNAAGASCIKLAVYLLGLRLVQILVRLYRHMSRFVDPHTDSFPSPTTVIFSVFSYIGVVVIGAIATAFPTPSMKKVVIVLGIFEFVTPFILAYCDYRRSRYLSEYHHF